MAFSKAIFGFVWKRLEKFDLDGHNLGTEDPWKLSPLHHFHVLG
jgi:hypothetical protein